MHSETHLHTTPATSQTTKHSQNKHYPPSNHHHPMSEGAQMRQAMEALLLQARVDVVFNGHVHAYERTHPVPDAGGITHITIGDGGNREQFATPWNDPQPAWSALRQDAYGFGMLELDGAQAQWTWLRNNDAWNPTAGTVGDKLALDGPLSGSDADALDSEESGAGSDGESTCSGSGSDGQEHGSDSNESASVSGDEGAPASVSGPEASGASCGRGPAPAWGSGTADAAFTRAKI